jgi:site-specific DNA-methyltransferase (adenine-specific)
LISLVPKKAKPAKRRAFYKSPPPKPLKVGSSRCDDRTAQRAVPTSDLPHAHPVASSHFTLREDGTIQVGRVTPCAPSQADKPAAGSGVPALPKLIFSSDTPFVRLYHGNCLELLDAIAAKYPDGRFDAIFADPPYFLSNGGITCHAGKMVKVDKGDWDVSRGPELNHEFNTEWLRRCQRVLKPNGTIWVTGTHHVIFSIGYALQQLGYKILNDIAWEKPNPPPNLSCRYFTHSTETVLWAAKNEKSKHVFNYAAMKAVTGKQMKTVWQFYPPARDEKEHGKHPTQKPVALIERCLLASTNEGDFVLDPFMGGGTTGVACVMNKRSFVGIELDAEHVQLASKRIQSHIASLDLFSRPIDQNEGMDMKPQKTLRQWLINNNYNDVAEMIDEISAQWAEQGKKTRRNWWDILAGDNEGNPREVEGRKFPVLRAARIRKGWKETPGCLCRNKAEKAPRIVPQARWQMRNGDGGGQ